MLIISFDILLLGMRYKILRNLHSIESCTLLYLVTHNPHDDAVGVRDILADTAHIYRVALAAPKA